MFSYSVPHPPQMLSFFLTITFTDSVYCLANSPDLCYINYNSHHLSASSTNSDLPYVSDTTREMPNSTRKALQRSKIKLQFKNKSNRRLNARQPIAKCKLILHDISNEVLLLVLSVILLTVTRLRDSVISSHTKSI